ncbi:molybdate ABC transporter permease subunit [Sneathiella chungangensis]|uniref:Molybdenum transport system permease n=1 Tax=Sneathiella chungangensis TaxID=1418234 RepID=A0A845MCH1_9PROT|nr:molybdate ABC transporter permease subunit [Sneathiella chungangensis]MZR21361.1 molybdate ABC transporter permease subunit [Sneathiella chungangensis]
MTISPAEIEVILLSLKVAIWCVAVSFIPALLVAWLLARRDFYGKTLVTVLVHLPIFLPPVVVGYFLLVTLGNRGVIGGWLHEQFGISLIFNWKGVVAATAVMAFPFIVRALRQAIEAVDKNLEVAALTLGRSPLMVFLTITLPLIAPGILAGITLGFAKALGEFGATITFVANIPGETQTLPLAIFTLLQTPDAESALWRLVIVSVLLAFAAIALSEWLARRSQARLGGR